MKVRRAGVFHMTTLLPREKAKIRRLAAEHGISNKQLGERFGVSPKTVATILRQGRKINPKERELWQMANGTT
jgi:transcriptional regulator with XRE-family HTH domain